MDKCKHKWIRWMDGYSVWIACKECGKFAEEEDNAGKKLAKIYEDNIIGHKFGTAIQERNLKHCEWEYRCEADSYWKYLVELVKYGVFTKEDEKYIRNSKSKIQAHKKIYRKKRYPTKIDIKNGMKLIPEYNSEDFKDIQIENKIYLIEKRKEIYERWDGYWLKET